MSKKEKEIRNMLDYIADKFHYIKKTENGFNFEHPLSLSHELMPNRENHSFNVDFKNNTIEVYSYDESHHNGDHWNRITTSLPWPALETVYASLSNVVRGLAEDEVMYQLKSDLVNKRLAEIINGK